MAEIFYNPDTDEYKVYNEEEELWEVIPRPETNPAYGYKWDYDIENEQWIQVEDETDNPDIYYDDEISRYKIYDDESESWVVIYEEKPTTTPEYEHIWSYDLSTNQWIQVLESKNRTDDRRVKSLNKEEIYTYERYSFCLKVLFTLNRDNDGNAKTISIRTYIDNDQYGETLTTTYIINNMEYYATLGKTKMDILKGVVNRSPLGIRETFSVNRYIFEVEIEVRKNANTNEVIIQGLLDNVYIWTPNTIIYNVDSLNNITDKVYEILNQIRSRLITVPVNYFELHSVDYLNFLIKVVYNKEKDGNVEIKLMLDGKDYKHTEVQFNIDNITRIKTTTDTMVNRLKARLNQFYKMKTIEFSVRNFVFNIQQINVKMPNIEVIKTFVLVDNIVRSDRIERSFDIDKIEEFNEYNDKMIDDMKENLTSLVPDNVRIVYTKDGVIYLIEVRFTKKKNSNVVVVSYYFNNGESLYLDYMDSYYLE